jgi:hypothetical protein
MSVFLFSFFLLAMVQWKMVENPILIAERFWQGAGWVQLTIISFYGAFVAYKMQDTKNVPRWRRITWTLFSVVFFGQLALGLLGAEKFLMTGKLHLPIPMMIVGGPVHRLQLSFMTILFLSTIVLTGPAWCSIFAISVPLTVPQQLGGQNQESLKINVPSNQRFYYGCGFGVGYEMVGSSDFVHYTNRYRIWLGRNWCDGTVLKKKEKDGALYTILPDWNRSELSQTREPISDAHRFEL